MKMFNEPQDGMTLRDYFAAKAIASLLSMSTGVLQINPKADYKKMIGVDAYAIADAMLEERNKS